MDEITLTEAELNEIKDTVAFRTKTTLTLKSLCIKIDGFSEAGKSIAVLKTHSKIHWFLISVLLVGLIRIAWSVIGK